MNIRRTALMVGLIAAIAPHVVAAEHIHLMGEWPQNSPKSDPWGHGGTPPSPETLDVIRSGFREPSSVIFGETFISKRTPTATSIRVCGWVNGRNGFGGMTGMVLFDAMISNGQLYSLSSLSGDPDEDHVSFHARHCER